MTSSAIINICRSFISNSPCSFTCPQCGHLPCHAPVDDDLDMVDIAMEEEEDEPELEDPEGGEGGVLLEEDSEE